ncbi:hypothetical protein FOXG_20840 [Fusarium oxysporum f. sp. lycopersici 4287]|uniref:Uncharacterized protein n=1 Tax=Fusarium oxysporum f. sp. lycopersici (strain 4287 / CBS 123668 / FGSC 9935 / NRRL 34936) TaxID=426428 RepID=A0A0J9VRZ0_FUSO4|nr:hypothetical protein FOXG_20840 [Fusarium oxysporum f. sp. lycopersici 4287]KNB13551.1 hypothetical protein FOXG_20840 [Fusarium oxysporum f. sp. lycopersici 4287]
MSIGKMCSDDLVQIRVADGQKRKVAECGGRRGLGKLSRSIDEDLLTVGHPFLDNVLTKHVLIIHQGEDNALIKYRYRNLKESQTAGLRRDVGNSESVLLREWKVKRTKERIAVA